MIGPHGVERRRLLEYLSQFFASYGAPPVEVPAELAQHLVFGAVEYARGLGFEPADGFGACAGHLGQFAGLSPIRFGRDGKPFYIAGPHDDAARVMRMLSRTVGQGNFRYLVPA